MPSRGRRSPSEDPQLITYDGRTPPFMDRIVSVPALTILYHPDLSRVGERALLGGLLIGKAVAVSRETPEFVAPGRASGEPLTDACMSRTPLFVGPLPDGGVEIALEESPTKLSYRQETVDRRLALSEKDVKRGVVFRLGGRIVLLLHQVSGSAPGAGRATELVGESDGIQQVRRDLERVADLDVPVLIRGETGTGKELVARAIHEGSARREGSFVAVNLAAIPQALAGAELFGAERGSFTGAVRSQIGYFNAARGGTLFLDEIGEAPADVQALLLRAIETGDVQGVGAQRTQKADVRIVAATDANLERLIEEGKFRAPLLHRLSAFEVRIPPLRERRDDIGRLLVSFLREELARVGEPHRLAPTAPGMTPWLPASLVARLADLDWPGNVRQLRNVVKQLVIGSRGQDHVQIGPAVERLLGEPTTGPLAGSGAVPTTGTLPMTGALPASAPFSGPVSSPVSAAPETPVSASSPGRRKPSEVTEEELLEVLRACRWDKLAAAERLRISRPSLYLLVENNPRIRSAGDVAAEEMRACYLACGGDVERMVDMLEVSAAALRRRIRELGLPLSTER